MTSKGVKEMPQDLTQMQDIAAIIQKQRDYYASGQTKEIIFRSKALRNLGLSIQRHEQDIMDALKKDLNKAPFEAYATEIGMVLAELRYMLRHLKAWSRPKRVKTSFTNYIASSRIYPEPYGVVLIMSPWNYPFMLTLAPLIGAIAAGNCAVIKPSNYSPNTSSVIDQILTETFGKDYITVILGGREANQSLLEQRFDYIFFTGSVAVGKTVMSAAAKNLTPVTLELGGKSPCIVDETANLDLAARRIVWGKFVNAGQTCVAPDYLLVHSLVKEELINKMKDYIDRFYKADESYNEFPKIINEKHFNRLIELIKGEEIITGGSSLPETNQIEPTILNHINWNSRIMEEEIFGPVLPILEYQDFDEILEKINRRQKPLAFYLFTCSRKNERKALNKISFGGGCINDTIMHLSSTTLPFGGVGESGMGGYHGKKSFDTFSHYKGVLRKSNLFDMPLRYPPYGNNIKILKKLLK